MSDNQWQQMVMDSLERIENKLDQKVSKDTCALRHQGPGKIRDWLAIVISILTLLGFLYVGFSVFNKLDNYQIQQTNIDTKGLIHHG
jgi:hypothetical protein